MISILTYISLFAGGILILLMLLSLIGGLDFDFDLGDTDANMDTDAGGLGVVKSLLTFISVTSWVIKLVIVSKQSLWVASAIGLISGALAVFILSWIFKQLLKNEENVNWEMKDALFQEGSVYLRIPVNGEGIASINVKGAKRELKARSNASSEIKTGDIIRVTDVEDDYVIVEPV